MNIRLLIDKLKSISAKDEECTLFIDSLIHCLRYSRPSATVRDHADEENSPTRGDRIPQDYTLDNLYFEGLGKRKVFLKNGGHQGSPVSPVLLNIYIEDMIAREVRELEDQNIRFKLYSVSN